MTREMVTAIVRRIGWWVAHVILVLFVFLTVYTWLDVLVLKPEEYERLLGGESGCGKSEAYCSWHAFVLDSVPDFIPSILVLICIMWRSLPKRELILGLLAVAICGYMGWRAYSAQVEASLS